MKNVLITGASKGIGAATARIFAKNGYKVFINYNNNKEKAEALAKEVGGIAIKCDVSNPIEVKEMAKTISGFGSIDVLVNNAGIQGQNFVDKITDKEWSDMIGVSLSGTFYTVREFAPDMIKNKRGKIINVSSMWGVTGASMETHYSAAKAGVIGFTKALAKELGPSNINVNCVAPGVIDTDMCRVFDDSVIDALKEETPLGRLGTPEEVARLIYFLASDDSSFITGQIIGVNGGFIINSFIIQL